MRRYLAYIFVLIIAVCIGLVIAQDPGYALFSYHHYTVEMPLWLAVFIAIVVFIVLAAILRLFDNTRYLLQRVRYWKQKQKMLSLQKQTQRGMLELLEGRFKTAERHLKSTTHGKDTPLMNYLSAAQAANALGAYDRRDVYLSKAKNQDPKAETAVLIIKAQLQIETGQLKEAENTLQRLYKKNPKHETVLHLLQSLYTKQKNWQALLDLTPKLKKLDILETEALDKLIITCELALLGETDNPTAHWEKLPRHLKKDNKLAAAYIQNLIAHGNDEQAKPLIEEHLKREWSDALCEAYGDLKTSDTEKQYKLAQKWLKQRTENADLLATLGKLAYRLQLWGKAKTYYQNSLAIKPTLTVYQRLGALLEQIGESTEALKQYREALKKLSK